MKDLIAGLALVAGAVALGRGRRGLSGLGYSAEEHSARGEDFLERGEYNSRSPNDSSAIVRALVELTEARVNFSAARDSRFMDALDKELAVSKLIRDRLDSCR